MRIVTSVFLLCVLVAGCSRSRIATGNSSPDRTVSQSKYPVAVDPSRVGTYPALAKSGAGYFYDEVLEYRVWMNPEGGGDDYYRAFASFEPALQFSKSTPGAEEPLVLVRQLEWINEPRPGEFEERSDERITEWQVGWLAGSKRTADSIPRFLSEKRKKR